MKILVCVNFISTTGNINKISATLNILGYLLIIPFNGRKVNLFLNHS